MQEAIVGAVLQVLLDKLAHCEFLGYFGRLMGVNQTLEKWRANLYSIQAVLKDAEERQLESVAVKLWLDDLRDLAYDVQNILDKFATEMLKRKIQGHQASTSTKVLGSLSKAKFSFDMNSEIKKITDRLQDISKRKREFGLKEIQMSTKEWKRPPSTCHPDGPVIGRDEEKRHIVEFLSKEEASAINYHVVAIVGMPGVGKTTLAGHVFNDSVTGKFHPKGWVCVSDDFNLEGVTTKILESVTNTPVKKFKEFNNIQENLRKELAGKTFLIVLDDVWHTCDYGSWAKLQSSFLVGAPGSKIIVTTRDANVARMMGAKVHDLGCISNDHCWKVFEQHAPLNIDNDILPNFEILKEKIIEQCNGLPLAARCLGGLLRTKEIDQWEEILNNKMWRLSDQSSILPVLKLSYHYLPSYLKQCFAYCSILPNDYEFEEKQLILLWMAEGLIQERPEDNKQKEELGGDYFQELRSRSLFQKSSKCSSRYVMHDLVGELARWAAGEICFRLEDKGNDDSQLRCFPKARHSSYSAAKYDGVKIFQAFSEVKRLRTFLPLSQSSWSYLAHNITFDLLPKLQYLWVLSLNGYQISELPSSIGKLKYLRYLDLSCTKITSLPESISDLYNLQTLILEGCDDLKALPKNMKNLINLRHLDNSYMSSLEGMPAQLGGLTNLQSLPNFVVGKASESGLTEIGPLLNLQGTLCLSRLENVIDSEDARKANLISKVRLDELLLKWSYPSDTGAMQSVVLDFLRPHRNLKELTIIGYAGSKFSTWIGDPLFSNMVLVSLQKCNNCRLLPPLGQLPSLKELHIEGMAAVESVGPEFYGEGSSPFAQLETLEFEDMQHWKKWFPHSQDEGIAVFPCLKMLSIKKCPKLEGGLPENPVSLLAKLKIVNCEELVVSLANYRQLCELYIHDCKGVVHTGAVDFELLESICLSYISELVVSLANYRQLRELDIDSCKGVIHTGAVGLEFLESIRLSNISELRLQNDEFLQGLRKVKDLKITGCENLTSLWKKEDRLLQHLSSLNRLHIEGNSFLVEKLGKEAEELLQLRMASNLEYLKLKDCESLLKVPEGLYHMTSLQELEIYGCSSLVSFPDVGLPPSLKVIQIWSCMSLMYFAKRQIPPSLKRIEINRCTNFKSLVEEESKVDGSSSSSSSSSHCLEHLEISYCRSLTSLTFRGQLPRALKHLKIYNCEQLESITEMFSQDNTCLEYIHISNCENLKSLPEGLCHLTALQTFHIHSCGNLVSFPRGGLPSNLREIRITGCGKLEVLPDMHILNSLQKLTIDYHQGFTSFPPNLTSLTIWRVKSCMRLLELEWGLHRLTSLRQLSIVGEDPDVVSFPPENKDTQLPKSLIQLRIEGFPNLRHLSSKAFQSLTSLESLTFYNCAKLASIPEEGLPLSLTQLEIKYCSALQKKWEAGKGRYWPKIAHIPYIYIQAEQTTEPAEWLKMEQPQFLRLSVPDCFGVEPPELSEKMKYCLPMLTCGLT